MKDIGHAKIKTVKCLKVCAIKCSKCSWRIHKLLRVLQFSANLVYLPVMVISDFEYNELMKENKV